MPSSLLEDFRTLHADYSPVPFYWWAGDPLNRERVAWQLDQLRSRGVLQTLISYPHDVKNATVVGEPALFSKAWWDFFRWFLEACRERGMTTGIQDYTLVGPILQDIGRDTPGMQGGQLACLARDVSDGGEVQLSAEKKARVIGAWAYPLADDTLDFPAARDLAAHVIDGQLSWSAPAGAWRVVLVFARLNPFDPLHPESGACAIEQLYQPFARECPDEVGRTLKIFFQDELDFGTRMPFWSNRLLDAFSAAKGYDLLPWLPALWLDLGPRTPKVRLDYADVVVRCLEDSYFKPIFAWHETHGTLFGNDNCGRGNIAAGRDFYGDYFRTMRWYSAPGSDDPTIENARAFKGIKVNSSIAHLYQRPRVWNEAFHSSGWGVTPARLVNALNEDFVYGATLVDLHGLYYSTQGGWWEWASPDFHFRQPFWKHAAALNHYFARLSWALAQGVHACDVALLYPIASLDAEPAVTLDFSDAMKPRDEPGAEQVAFGLGKFLFDRTCDFDFIDFESLQNAATRERRLQISGESYQALILPAMAAIHFSSLLKAAQFVAQGGVVIAYGRLPLATEREGRDDAQLLNLLREIFGWDASAPQHDCEKLHASGGRGVFISHDEAAVLRVLNALIERDVTTSLVPLQVLHRRIDTDHLYFVFNPTDEPLSGLVHFRALGKVEAWKAWTGDAVPHAVHSSDQTSTSLELSLAPREAHLLRFDSAPGEPFSPSPLPPPPVDQEALQLLKGSWSFTLQPTLDNRFGDFREPATSAFIGAEARRFRWAEEDQTGTPSWHETAFDDSAWLETTYSFGARFLRLGPFLPGTDFTSLEQAILPSDSRLTESQPYAFSLHWGIERDPYLIHPMSGPHGLKHQVPDDYLDFYDPKPGTVWYLRAVVTAERNAVVPFLMGGRCAYAAWLNGEKVLEQTEALPPGVHPPWDLPHYDATPRETRVRLREGDNDLLVKLVQPDGQRTRAFVAFAPPPPERNHLGLRWFTDPAAPRPAWPASPERKAIWFRCPTPPGLREIEFTARGAARAWSDGNEIELTRLAARPDGCFRYLGRVAVVSASPGQLALRVEAPLASRGGDALPEPVLFHCGEGRIDLGDWCNQGLATYSGIGIYRTTFSLDEIRADRRVMLDLGDLSATAELTVNGRVAGTLITPPWQMDLTPWVQPGANELAIAVANTLANHYSVGIPSPYFFPAQTRSGLFGPVRVYLSSATRTTRSMP